MSRTPFGHRPARRASLALIALVLVTGACGGHMTRAEIISALHEGQGTAAPGPAGTTEAAGPTSGVLPAGTVGGDAVSGTVPGSAAGASTAAPAVSASTGAAIVPGASTVASGAKSAGTGGTAAQAPKGTTGGPAVAGGSTASAGAGGAAPAAGAPATATGSPMLLAQVGTWSGPIGSAFKDLITGARVWVQDVNSRGGVAGHPVQLLVADDGGDPARYQSLLKEMVETRGAFAFLGNNGVFTGPAGKDYLESKRVPVIGGDVVNPVWTGSSMYFPEGTTLTEIAYAVPVANVRFTTKKKVGIITCQEVEACRVASKVWPEASKKLGLDVVYTTQASVAQPDFTAECLNARNAGADVMQAALDASTLVRFGKACTQLGFRPQIIVPSAAIEAKLQGDVADNFFDGLIGAINDAPFMVSDQPGPAAFQTAVAKYAAGAPASLSTLQGWASGKLFEKAAAGLGAQPARDQLLNGLWSLQGETLAGLAPPLTFAKDKPSPAVPCFFVIKIVDKKFTAPNGSQKVCP